MLTRAEAVQKMNQLGESKTPFLFFTDFPGETSWVKPLEEVDREDIDYSIGYPDTQRKRPASSINFEKKPITFETFQKAFDQVVHEIRIGNSFLVNLTFKTPIATDLSLKEIFDRSLAKYKLRYQDQFVVFSPETFIRIEDGHIYSYPMKGTIDAAITDARKTILNDLKETSEHVTIVDLIRNDLSQVADEITVTRFRFTTEVHTHEKKLLQVSSEIRGKLKPGFQKELGSLIFQLLPAGSISGAPKPKTVEIIKNTENYDRNFYTGVCGLFDGHKLDSGVMIRFIEKEKGQLYYKSGGGITSFSDARKEYQEFIDKIYVPIH